MSGEDINPNDLVFNAVYYSSGEEDEEDEKNYEEITSSEEEDYESCDEESLDKQEILQNLLKDIANVDCIAKNTFRVEFFDTKNIKFMDKKENCEFDLNKDGLPILPDGGEEFFPPFMSELIKKDKRFKKVKIQTNIKGKKFTF